MTPADLTLARELVALDCWEWPEGDPNTTASRGGLPTVAVEDALTLFLPDLTHPLTKGWLLHLARKVWDCPFVTVGNHDGMTWAGDPPPGFWFATVGEHTFYGPAEHAALVAAIKAGAGR